MKSTLLITSIGLLAAFTGSAVLADSRHSRDDDNDQPRVQHRDAKDAVMQTVPVNARPGEPGDGWRYYSNAAAHTAVVISPQGEYFYSRGKGPRLIAVTRP
jgi:hypothetical protein